MINSLESYWKAKKCLKLEDPPRRRPDNIYEWTSYHRDVLIQNTHRISEIDYSIRDLRKRESGSIKEINIYKKPVEELDRVDQERKRGLKKENDLLQHNLDKILEEKEQIEVVLSLNGVINTPSLNDNKANIGKKTTLNWWKHHVFSFLGLWLLSEILLTAMQWSSLRDILSIEQMLFRSAEIGILILLYKIIAYKRGSDPRVIYTIYMFFTITMVAIMVFGPPLLYYVFPFGGQSGAAGWSLNIETINNQLGPGNIPSWAQFMWEHQWIPAVLSVLGAIVLLFGLKPSKIISLPTIESNTDTAKDSLQEILTKHQYLTNMENTTNEKLIETQRIIDEIDQNPIELSKILMSLESMNKDRMNCLGKIEGLKNERNNLITAIETEFTAFQHNYMRQLKNDNVLNAVMKPEWPTREDILNYFNINN